MDLEQYIKVKYKGKENWFVEEVGKFTNQQRINEVIANKDYLNGKHDILKRPNYVYNGEVVESRRIVLQTAKTLLQFQVEYLLKNPVQITGDEEMSDMFSMVNKAGKYDFVNKQILQNILRFGESGEYVYVKSGKIYSKVMSPDTYTAIYNRHTELIGVIEHYSYDGVMYYNVYEEDVVKEYSTKKGRVVLDAQYANLSGLPIIYTSNEYGDSEVRSQLDDWKGILDNLEDLLSKTTDSVYKAISGIPILSGQPLRGQLPVEIAGAGLAIDDGATFKFESNQTDYKSFKELYSTLSQSLMDVSMTPQVSMNASGVSNLSEVSIKLLFSLADVRASMNESHLKQGLHERYEKMRTLLTYRGVDVSDESFYTLDFVFTYDMPSNESEVIGNLSAMREMGAISMESILERAPYVNDAVQELERLKAEGVRMQDTGDGRQEEVEEE